ncbi:SusC/RagA family TonB-linked outer membrane protein [Belliella aquatica]|uniref:SusC/RagA family TonB-linked outer membrane protein n=1 Tax=Belliella aquatica TaxID=1323734 RepID=A0ABQ1MYU4_9BACT|nr:SusC/RagA family TonB-linked outer membrane protein [Belliella aquatica]MCH7407445.1 SusC/RagA family TonB-linked outer membrane protein [Belliella aquatica]GGC49274.1 SusC/RagA family TonB-linked outer membrane protein [Belliella aquatica]
MMKRILPIVLMWLIAMNGIAQDVTYRLEGKVSERSSGASLPGALVSVGDLSKSTISDENGAFSMRLPRGKYTLTVSYLGFSKYEQEVEILEDTSLNIVLQEDGMDLSEVEVMATGYQEIPRERATGSFVQVDNELVNRRISTNILDRLEDVTPGLVFNRAGPGGDPISIRGRNTLFANTQPLIIIDNFPYDGPLENINPNDVETITVLRDAAAASIWGARAGNGVIVITTKKAAQGAFRLTINSNVNIIDQPDLFYEPVLSIGDYIDVEQMLFGRNFYNASINNINRPALSPGVEAMLQARNGQISQEELERQLAEFRTRDTRTELMQHFYRPAINQQHNINLSGGTQRYNYALSIGMDKNLDQVVGNDNARYTLSSKHNWKLLNDKLEVGAGIYLVRRDRNTRTEVPRDLFPYERFKDSNGNALPVVFGYNRRFIDANAEKGLLDWNYYPTEEIGARNSSNIENDLRLNLNLGYEIANGLKASVFYQYWTNTEQSENLQTPDLYSTRDIINRFTQVQQGGALSFPIPRNSTLSVQNQNAFSHSLRGQLAYKKELGQKGVLDAIGGWELKDFQSFGRGFRYYGYRENIGVSQPVDLINTYRQFHSGAQAAIVEGASHNGMVDRFLSQFVNAAYTYDNKYNVSFSARRDGSNLFGVEANQRVVPLWSTGIGWVISEENFFKSNAIPYLRLRATYGENGNVDKSVSALTTATYFTNFSNLLSSGELAAIINTPENRQLRWERIKILNFGLDFETKDGRIRGQLEGYVKNGIDLIGDSPFSPSTGFFRVRTNSASTQTKGLDFDIQSRNTVGKLKWTTNFLISHVNEEVTDYFYEGTPINYLSQGAGQLSPLEGRPLFAIYSIPWGGLNPDNGNPRGILDGEVSENYLGIFRSLTPENLTYHGPRRPSWFGAIRNTFQYQNFTLSANLSFRGGYYYRRESVLYATVLTGRGGHGDYAKRWQQPGDEVQTQVPSMPASNNVVRDNIYRYSDQLVERGDHIRFQDIRLAYTIGQNQMPRLPFARAEVYTYINNIGILWKYSDDPIDPDFRQLPPQRSIAFGVNLNF